MCNSLHETSVKPRRQNGFGYKLVLVQYRKLRPVYNPNSSMKMFYGSYVDETGQEVNVNCANLGWVNWVEDGESCANKGYHK